ncbi:hypothetical protein [Streptomyces sp. TRM49041]|uniref:hypothetical protein n=1 Tax=Streptomyces sp. TRM49041 TaxID=2603216 RepID=UPI0021CD0757|nr:hypothetical protein [Streptomyces sp. TRM49041]
MSLAIEVLGRYRLGIPHEGLVRATVPKSGNQECLLQAMLPFGDMLEVEIKRNLTTGEIGAIDLYTLCDGIVESGDRPETVEGLFALTVEVSGSFFHVELTTFSDAWMPFDLRGREQQAIFAENRPRLSAALVDLSEALGLEVDPEDPTWFGIPTETGVENHFEDDGSPSDVWGRFEIPHRNGVFSQTPKFKPGYVRQASGPVEYLPVHGKNAILGYLWASDADGAASFEARDEADLDGYRAGLIWLDRLQEAYEQGLTPSAALTALRTAPEDHVAGQVKGTASIRVDEFWKLREKASN